MLIAALNSNREGECFTLERCSASDTVVVVNLVINAPFWDGDHENDCSITAEMMPLSRSSLVTLRETVASWLRTDVTDAQLLNGAHQLAADEHFVLDVVFGSRDDTIAPPEKPTVTLRYRIGKLSGQFSFVTDQSCIMNFSRGLLQIAG